MKQRYKVNLGSPQGENKDDLEIIEADLRRSDFAMPSSRMEMVSNEKSVEEIVLEVLNKLSANLPFGYLQGMNYVVITLYRVTGSTEMTFELALKLFSNERLTRVFLDETA